MKVANIQEKIREKIPEGLVMARHSERGHFYEYTPTRSVYPSVTTKTSILGSDHLKMWAVNEGLSYLERVWHDITLENRSEIFRAAQLAHVSTFEDAGDIGTKIHNLIEEYLNEWIDTGVQPDDIRRFVAVPDIRLIALARSAELFFNDYKATPVVAEMKVASPKHKYGGTMDALMMIDNKLVLCDWKSSNTVKGKDTYAMQISAYAQALYELSGIRPKELYIVRISKEKACYEVVKVTSRAKSFKAFLNTTKVYDWLHDGEQKIYPLNTKTRIKI